MPTAADRFTKEMDQRVFEGRFLINIIGGIVRQDKVFPTSKTDINWERMYHLADYHDVANTAYLGILGMTERLPDVWQEKFRQRYQEALTYNNIYTKAELDILKLFNRNRIDCTVLESSAIRKFYKVPEAAGNSPLRLYFGSGNYTRAKGFLISKGFEAVSFFPDGGEKMRSPEGFYTEIYDRFPFVTQNFQKNAALTVGETYQDPDFAQVKNLTLENDYIYKMAEIAYHYCSNSLTLRELLDAFLYYKKYHKTMDMRFVGARLKLFNVDVLCNCLIHMAAMWFGTAKDDVKDIPRDDMSVFDQMEYRIFSSGSSGEEKIPQAIALQQDIVKSKAHNENQAKRRKDMDSIKDRMRIFFHLPEKEKDEEPDLYMKGHVSFETKLYGILVRTPYYTLTLPLRWKNHGEITQVGFREDFRHSTVPANQRDPHEYMVYVDFTEPMKGARAPLLTFCLYSDIKNAADLVVNSVGVYYLGKMLHRNARHSYTLHLVCVYEKGSYYGSKENEAVFRDIVERLDAVTDSVLPVNDPKGNNVNVFQKYAHWKSAQLPEEYRGMFGNSAQD